MKYDNDIILHGNWPNCSTCWLHNSKDRVKYNTIGLGTLLLIGLKSSAAQHWSDTLEPQQL